VKKKKESMGNRMPANRWRPKESRPTPKEENVSMELPSSTLTKPMEVAADMSKLSVQERSEPPNANGSNVSLPSYVTSAKGDSIVFGLKDGEAEGQNKFLQNSEMFGLSPAADSMQTQMSNFSTRQEIREGKHGESSLPRRTQANTIPDPSSSSSSSPPISQTEKPIQTQQNSTAASTQQEEESQNELSRMPIQGEMNQPSSQSTQTVGDTIPTGVSEGISPTMPQQTMAQHSSHVGKSAGRANAGDQTMGMYATQQHYAPTMHPYMPSGERNYYEGAATAQMHPAYFPEYQMQQPRYLRGSTDQRPQNPRTRMYSKQGGKSASKGMETMKDSKQTPPQMDNSTKNGRGKQSRGINNQKYPQRGGNYKGQIKQGFSKSGGFGPGPKRQGLQPQPPFNQQTYAMGAPAVQFQHSAHVPYPYPHNFYNNYQYAPQFGQPGFRGSPHGFYQPAPNGYYNHTAAAPASFHNPAAAAAAAAGNYEEQYGSAGGDGKAGYQSQPRGTQGGGPMISQQPAQNVQMPVSDTSPQSGFPHVPNGAKQLSTHPGNSAPRESTPSHGNFDRSSWTTSQMSAPSTQSSKLVESKPSNVQMVGSNPSQNYRQNNFAPYMTQNTFTDQQQIPQNQYWNSAN